MTVGTNGTACDANRGLTTRGAAFNDTGTFVIGIGSHRAIGTATINIM